MSLVDGVDREKKTVELDLLELAVLYIVWKNPKFHHILDLFTVFSSGDQSDSAEKDVYTFLYLFGGKTIEVPSRKDLKRAIRDVLIWKNVKQADKDSAGRMTSDAREEVESLASRWGVSTGNDNLSRIVRRVDEMLDEYPSYEANPESIEDNRMKDLAKTIEGGDAVGV